MESKLLWHIDKLGRTGSIGSKELIALSPIVKIVTVGAMKPVIVSFPSSPRHTLVASEETC